MRPRAERRRLALVTQFRCGGFLLDLSRPRVMGVLNVTPDSFSDGGELQRAGRLDLGLLRERGEQLLAEGAAVLDVGGESTRPGAVAITSDEERVRVLPAVAALVALGAPVSIDTSDPAVMRAAIDLGAVMVNDVRALQRRGAMDVIAGSAVGVCLMHMRGEPDTMQRGPAYDDVVAEVHTFLRARIDACVAAGIGRERLLADPGFGFGKSLAHNLALLRNLDAFADLGLPLLVGLSRKGSIGVITGQTDARLRVAGSVAAALIAAQRGAKLIRVHDVRATVDALKVLEAVEVAQ